MKRMAAALGAFLLCFLVSAQEHKLTVKVVGLPHRDGKMNIGIFKAMTGRWKEDRSYTGVTIPIHRDTVWHTFSLVAESYAIAVYQDMDGNNKLDRTMLGLPKEPYGFSNAKSAPDFKHSVFPLERDTTVFIRLKNSSGN